MNQLQLYTTSLHDLAGEPINVWEADSAVQKISEGSTEGTARAKKAEFPPHSLQWDVSCKPVIPIESVVSECMTFGVSTHQMSAA